MDEENKENDEILEMQQHVENMTLGEARAMLLANRGNNDNYCSCCGRKAKIYPHLMSAEKVGVLLLLLKHSLLRDAHGWVHIVGSFTKSLGLDARKSGYSKLKYWGFIEQKTHPKDSTKKCSGIWRITKEGIEFGMGRSRVPKIAFVYLDTVLSFSTETFSVEQALEEKFDYRELLKDVHEHLEGEKGGLDAISLIPH